MLAGRLQGGVGVRGEAGLGRQRAEDAAAAQQTRQHLGLDVGPQNLVLSRQVAHRVLSYSIITITAITQCKFSPPTLIFSP